MIKQLLCLVFSSTALVLFGCSNHADQHHDMSSHDSHAGGMMMPNITHAIAVLHPTQGNSAAGTVHFHQMGADLHVVADIYGLDPNTTRGFHIHEFGDCSAPDGMSAGGHFAGAGHQHGKPTDMYPNRHAGDMG